MAEPQGAESVEDEASGPRSDRPAEAVDEEVDDAEVKGALALDEGEEVGLARVFLSRYSE